jgi:hypothetical protein
MTSGESKIECLAMLSGGSLAGGFMLVTTALISAAASIIPLASAATQLDASAEVDALLASLRVPASQRSDWTTFRVAGDLFAATTRHSDELYTFGPCKVTTALPVGYPAPTPPGAVELKRYPTVRRAEYRGTGNNRMGRNIGFWPLFRHIQTHDIAMTAPVEMDFHSREGLVNPEAAAPADAPSSWTMSFLYRTPELNATGTEGTVVVTDAAPITVIAVGTRGSYSDDAVEEGLNQLMTVLAAHPDWRPAGAPRAMYYNGPDTRERDLWGEIQIPIVAREPAPSSEPVKQATPQ